MSTHKRIATSAEVWAVIRARHGKELKVFETFSDPDGEYGGPMRCEMMTVLGLAGADFPLIGARTTWEKGEPSYKRVNEKHEYWLCVNTKDDE